MEGLVYCIVVVSSYWLTRKLMEGNWKGDIVSLPEMKRNYTIKIGIHDYKPIFHNFTKHPHMLVAGTTGYGKTNFLKCLISQVTGEVVLIDLKGGFDYETVTATNIHEAERELKQVVDTMKRRRKEHIFVIVDEAGELQPPSYLDKEGKRPYLACLHYVNEIGRLGRGFNTHLIYATQYPTSDIVPREIKQNCETRVCFRLPTEIASRVALDESGAELLESGNYGLGIYKRDYCLEVKTYKFVERVDYDVVVRKMAGQENGDSIIFE